MSPQICRESLFADSLP